MEIRSTGNPIHWVRTQIGDKYAELLSEIQRAAITLDLEVFVVWINNQYHKEGAFQRANKLYDKLFYKTFYTIKN